MKKLLPKSINNPQGFTLVELMVVISIIAILSVVGITIFSGVQKNSRDARRKSDVDAISKALEVGYSAGVYPTTLTTAMFAGGNVPVDPGSFTYTTTLSTSSFTVCAQLESSTGNSSSNGGAAQANGIYNCRKSSQ